MLYTRLKERVVKINHMAHLEVEPKPTRSRWIWILIIIAVLILAGVVVSQFKQPGNVATVATIPISEFINLLAS